MGGKVAHHGDQVPEGERMAAGIAMGAALCNGPAVDDAPGPAVQKGAHAGAQNHRQNHTVYGYHRGSVEHMQRLPLFLFVCIRSAVGSGSAAGLRNKEAAIQGIPDADTAFPNFGDTGAVSPGPLPGGHCQPNSVRLEMG